MKQFNFGHSWQVYGNNSTEVPDHFTIEEAKKYVQDHWDDIPLASDANYVTGSDEPDFENCDFEEN